MKNEQRVTLTMKKSVYNELVGRLEEYAVAVAEDGEANEASNEIADLLLEYRRGGGFRWRS